MQPPFPAKFCSTKKTSKLITELDKGGKYERSEVLVHQTLKPFQ